MHQAAQHGLARRLGELIAARTTDMADRVVSHPAATYTDPARQARERKILFRRYPVAVGVSASIPHPGDFFTLDIDDLPVLVVRGDDGVVRAMINICRHRANRVCSQVSGSRRLFSCDYHSWTYDTRGRLKSVVDRAAFREVSQEERGLVELPTEVRHGLIWCVASADTTIDVASFLGDDLDAELAGYGLASYTPFRSIKIVKNFNWKLGVDTFLEVFHVAHLHRLSVSDLFIGNTCAHDRFGVHSRLTTARRTLPQMLETPPPEWDVLRNVSMVYLAFPNTCINWVMDHVEIWSFFPDPRHDNRCTAQGTLLVPESPETPSALRHWERTWKALEASILTEDFTTMETIQSNLETAAVTELVIGRNEISLQGFHASLDAALQSAASLTDAA